MASYSDDMFLTLAKNLKKYRKQAGYTQVKLSLKLGKGSDYIAQIERGFRTPSLKSLCEITQTLNVDMYKFFIS